MWQFQIQNIMNAIQKMFATTISAGTSTQRPRRQDYQQIGETVSQCLCFPFNIIHIYLCKMQSK